MRLQLRKCSRIRYASFDLHLFLRMKRSQGKNGISSIESVRRKRNSVKRIWSAVTRRASDDITTKPAHHTSQTVMISGMQEENKRVFKLKARLHTLDVLSAHIDYYRDTQSANHQKGYSQCTFRLKSRLMSRGYFGQLFLKIAVSFLFNFSTSITDVLLFFIFFILLLFFLFFSMFQLVFCFVYLFSIFLFG